MQRRIVQVEAQPEIQMLEERLREIVAFKNGNLDESLRGREAQGSGHTLRGGYVNPQRRYVLIS